MAAGLHGDEGSGGQPRESARPAAGGRRVSLIAPDAGAAQRLIERGMALRLRAPELAMVFGERAAALAEAAGSERQWAQAEGLAVVGRARLGQRAGVVDRAVATLRSAEADGQTELAAAMRVELALCARSVGVPLTGLAAIRPVLGDPDISAATRAAAMLQFVGCMTPLGRRRVLDRALAEADELVSADADLPAADRTLLRALVCSRAAACQRRYGDLAAAMERAREGIELLDGLEPAAADGLQLRARLVLELVCALLDQGAETKAAELAEPLLFAPARASATGPLAWLRLAVATRIYMPAGAAEAAATLVRDALYGAQRHELLTVTARLWLELSHIEERVGRSAEAVRCMREARMSEHIYGRLRRQALGLLIGEFGRGEQHVVDFPRALGEQPRSQQPVPPPRKETLLAAEFTEAPKPEPPEQADAVTATAEPEPATGGNAAEPNAAKPVAEEPSAEQATESAEPARHRSADTVDARSVLERLGVTVSSGGRRRARDEAAAEQDRARVVGSAAAVPEVASEPEASSEPVAAAEKPEPAEVSTVDSKPAEPPKPESPAPVAAPEQSEPRKLDSVLAVFSNWTDDDGASSGVVAPRARRRRHELAAGEPLAASGRKVNGDDAVGRHRSEA